MAIGSSTLTAITTSNGTTGSTNAMPDSLTPVASAVPLSNMLLGEIIFGGLGTGLYSMIMIALVGLFMAGLMIGRTPEYIGKRIGPREMKPVMLFNLATPIAVLATHRLGREQPRGTRRADHQHRPARLHRNPLRLRILHG